MGIDALAVDTAVDLVKSENIQNKASSLLGMLFPYAGIEKRALDMYIGEIEKSNMSSEAKLIAVLSAKDTIKKLKNKKSVAEIAIANAKEGTVFDSSSNVNPEWLERFMDSAGFVSEEQVQLMWGKILAKEFEQPGSTPLNMIRILSEITPKYAKAFQRICSMKRLMIIVDDNGNVIAEKEHLVVPNTGGQLLGLHFEILNELETLGLIKFDPFGGFALLQIPEKGVLTYTNGITKEIEKHPADKLPVGNVMLTEAGECLRKITQTDYVTEFEPIEKEYMIKAGIVYKEPTEYSIFDDGSGELILKRIPVERVIDNKLE